MTDHTALTAALNQDHANRTIHFDLEMAWIRRGVANLPQPPSLRRTNHYFFDIHREGESFCKNVHTYPRLLTIIQEWVATTGEQPLHKVKEAIQSLIAFFRATNNEHWLNIPTDHIDFAVIMFLRKLSESCYTATLHAAICQLIITKQVLYTYGEQRANLYKDCLPLDEESQKDIIKILYPFRHCTGLLQREEFADDLQLAIATATIDFHLEDECYRTLRKAVHLGRELTLRMPLLTVYYRASTDADTPHLEWLGQMLWHADSLQEVADAVDAAGITVGPSPPGR